MGMTKRGWNWAVLTVGVIVIGAACTAGDAPEVPIGAMVSEEAPAPAGVGQPAAVEAEPPVAASDPPQAAQAEETARVVVDAPLVLKRQPATAEDVSTATSSAALATGPVPPPRGRDTGTIVDPDPGYRDALVGISFGVQGWKTDFSRHTVPYGEIFSGGPPPDGIPPIDNPKFVPIEGASAWRDDLEPVIVLELNGRARAYPIQILTWHEVVNDQLGGVPITVTFCQLCNSALAFDRRLDGTVYDFGTSGNLRKSDLIMWDRQTETWWQQLTGEAIVGELAGKRLDFIPAARVSFADFRAAHPNSDVLSRETGACTSLR